MSHTKLAVALIILAAGAPALAQPLPAESRAGAPAAGPAARYCMRVEAATGSRIERVMCWTRQEWFEQGVDVEEDWPREGVSVIE
jgi:hypothetical protein